DCVELPEAALREIKGSPLSLFIDAGKGQEIELLRFKFKGGSRIAEKVELVYRYVGRGAYEVSLTDDLALLHRHSEQFDPRCVTVAADPSHRHEVGGSVRLVVQTLDVVELCQRPLLFS